MPLCLRLSEPNIASPSVRVVAHGATSRIRVASTAGPDELKEGVVAFIPVPVFLAGPDLPVGSLALVVLVNDGMPIAIAVRVVRPFDGNLTTPSNRSPGSNLSADLVLDVVEHELLDPDATAVAVVPLTLLESGFWAGLLALLSLPDTADDPVTVWSSRIKVLDLELPVRWSVDNVSELSRDGCGDWGSFWSWNGSDEARGRKDSEEGRESHFVGFQSRSTEDSRWFKK